MQKIQKKERRMKEKQVYGVLAVGLRKLFQKTNCCFEMLQEIRLRVGEPVLVKYAGQEYFFGRTGEFCKELSKAYLFTKEELSETLNYISNYSMYAFEEQIKKGYITLPGGHRVGLAGRVLWENQAVKNIRHISFLNIRIAHEVTGCADCILPYIHDGKRLYHTLLISPPCCGKTTLLRDIIRQCSDGFGRTAGMNVGVVDERSEIGASYAGKPQNHVGCRTDLLDGCPKSEGMMMLVRAMSPQVIAVDEIGSREDVEAIEYVMNCGVSVLATVHGSSVEELKCKPVLGEMLQKRMFQRYVVLSAERIGQIESVFDERGSLLAGHKMCIAAKAAG